ncbi:hypothetical protein KCQ_05471 [Pectobacterium atrosepticum ICMP 1526]|uniref:hypothetical protein n=1 Tax=Pectobacterium atrosepticum TaxID=29471 RepID=UPI0005060339|nr:hypothetical protein [Pectobacterium atrosepticum]KFX10729.1 hypothetical protein JV34_22695 [Pectobacterium atrosepticum]KMK87233.1 hypothetical protein KCQ_05471 [Pectobacterium atrosepticum ICMP 1526]
MHNFNEMDVFRKILKRKSHSVFVKKISLSAVLFFMFLMFVLFVSRAYGFSDKYLHLTLIAFCFFVLIYFISTKYNYKYEHLDSRDLSIILDSDHELGALALYQIKDFGKYTYGDLEKSVGSYESIDAAIEYGKTGKNKKIKLIKNGYSGLSRILFKLSIIGFLITPIKIALYITIIAVMSGYIPHVLGFLGMDYVPFSLKLSIKEIVTLVLLPRAGTAFLLYCLIRFLTHAERRI